MSKLIIDSGTLSSIGAAIREKTGTTDLLSPSQMVTAINNISIGSSGGGITVPEEVLNVSGDIDYYDYGGRFDWLLKTDQVYFSDITRGRYAFANSNLEEIPQQFFDGFSSSEGMTMNCEDLFCDAKKLKKIIPTINLHHDQYNNHGSLSGMFKGCINLKEIGKMRNIHPTNISRFLAGCYNLRNFPEIDYTTFFTANFSGTGRDICYCCYSLRSVPKRFLQSLNMWRELYTNAPSALTYNGFAFCYALDELQGLPFCPQTIRADMFYNCFYCCYRLKDIIFATQSDGTPYSRNVSAQCIDLTKSVGWCTEDAAHYITDYNSGITIDKKVSTDEQYQALKNDPDWFAAGKEYSRYNHDSAVRTINSLPDTSEYLASNGGTNTIKFTGAAGSLTDGGAINTLTETEIAVATSKGWTVTII